MFERQRARKRQRLHRSFADAVVRRRAMQARVEVASWAGVRSEAEDGREVAAGGHAESMDEIARRPLVLCFTKMRRPSANTKAAMSTAFPLACSLGTAPGLW